MVVTYSSIDCYQLEHDGGSRTGSASKMKTARTVQQENARKEQNRLFLNLTTAVRGTHVSEGDSEYYTYGYANVSFWNPSTQMWELCSNPDKFLVTDTDYDSASQLFWDRWSSYCQRRFSRNFLKIERI